MLKYLSKILYVFPSRKITLVTISFAFLCASALEAFGIGMIGPFIALATNPEVINQISWLYPIYTYLNITSQGQFVALLGLIIVILFIAKSFVNWKLQDYVFIFSYTQQGRLASKLLHAYLSAPYTFHLSKNSAHIIHTITVEARYFADAILIPLLMSVSNVAVILLLVILLCKTNLAAIVAILGITVPLFLVYNYSKDKIKQWGVEATQASEDIIRSINHSLGSIKETQVIGCGPYFEAELAERAERYVKACGAFYAFKLSPRILVEMLLVIFLVGFTSIFLLFNKSAQELSSILGVFAIASIRLIPAISNVATAISVLRNQTATLDKLYFDLKEIETVSPLLIREDVSDFFPSKQTTHSSDLPEVMSFSKEINISSVRYQYPNASVSALEKVSLSIKKGQSIALIGKSGAGKTTLVDVILGLLVPQDGDITVDRKSIYGNLRAWQNLIGYIPQSIFLMDSTIESNIAFGVPDHLIDQEKLYKSIQAAHLTEVVEALPEGVKTKVGERGVLLSGGQRQRIGIARALYHEREILVLDEATAALDNETEKLISESIKSLGGAKTLIIIAHRLSTVEHCDCIYLMEKGQIVKSGAYSEVVLKKSEEVINRS